MSYSNEEILRCLAILDRIEAKMDKMQDEFKKDLKEATDGLTRRLDKVEENLKK